MRFFSRFTRLQSEILEKKSLLQCLEEGSVLEYSKQHKMEGQL